MTEELSVWMDGELQSAQSLHLPLQLKRDTDLRAKWDCYHLIGDALRGIWGPDLCAKVSDRLDSEPTALAPRWRKMAAKRRRHALPAVATAAAVVIAAFVGFVAPHGVQQDIPPIAAIPKPEPKQFPVAAWQGANDYLLAHQRYSPSTALQGIASYVSTVAEVPSPVISASTRMLSP